MRVGTPGPRIGVLSLFIIGVSKNYVASSKLTFGRRRYAGQAGTEPGGRSRGGSTETGDPEVECCEKRRLASNKKDTQVGACNTGFFSYSQLFKLSFWNDKENQGLYDNHMSLSHYT